MKYAHILAAVGEERWAIERSKLQTMLDFLAEQAGGMKLSEDVRADRLSGRTSREPSRREGVVAILPLRGVIANRMGLMTEISGGTSNEGFARMFDAAVADPDVQAIVIDVDSPGGAVSGTAELCTKIFAARGRKPIVAHVNATAASAAYWIATAADEIAVTPTGVVGSIGVFAVHDDVSGALDKAGVRKTIVSAGDFKAAGNPFEPLGDDTRARMQARIDNAYDMFVTDVARNRGVGVGKVKAGFGRGDILDAKRALAEGMVDRIETLEETLRRVSAAGSAMANRPKFPERQKRAAALASAEFMAAAKLSLIEDDAIIGLRGVATVFGQVAHLDEPTCFLPGAFSRSAEPRLLRDHNGKRTLAPAGRVTVAQEGNALTFRCKLVPDAFGSLALEALAAGLAECSVGYQFRGGYHRYVGGRSVRMVSLAALPEISLVRTGAFRGTSVQLVSLCGRPLDEAVALFRERSAARRARELGVAA